MEKGGGAGGMATEMAVGLSIAQQIMQQQGMPGAAGASAAAAGAVAAARAALARRRRQGARRHRSRTCWRSSSRASWRPRRSARRTASSESALDEYLAEAEVRAGRSRRMADSSPPSTNTRAPRAARRREWNPAKQLLVCPFCGTAAPFTVDAATGAIVRARSRQGAARAARRSARLAGREAHGPVPELQGGVGVRSGARRAELRLLRLAGARRLHGDQGADPAAEPAAVQGHRSAASASRSGEWYASKWLAPNSLQVAARSSIASTASTFPTGRSTRRSSVPWEAEAGHYYYTTETLSRQARASRRRGRSGTSAGSRRPARSGTSSTTSRCPGRTACRTRCSTQVEPFPTSELVPYDTAFLSRASSSSTTRSCCSTRRSSRRTR